MTFVFLPAQFSVLAMSVPAPHFLLFSASEPAATAGQSGEWRFVLEAIGGASKIEVADSEPQIRGERLELLAVVRGLEALEQPSRVTLLTPSRYVARGIANGLNDWRENDWQWEHHGAMAPVKNRDLWQRIDRALEIHNVECRQWRIDDEHSSSSPERTRMVATPLVAPRRSGHRPDAAQPQPADPAPTHSTVTTVPGATAGSPSNVSFSQHMGGPAERSSNGARRISSHPAIVWRFQPRGGRLNSLRLRRKISDWLSAAWIKFRQLAAPLVRAPWLD